MALYIFLSSTSIIIVTIIKTLFYVDFKIPLFKANQRHPNENKSIKKIFNAYANLFNKT